jgi:hypothetical protein
MTAGSLNFFGLLSGLVGFVILYWNGNLSRNLNQTQSISIYDEPEPRVEFVIENSRRQKFFDKLGFGTVALSFVLQGVAQLI